MDTKIKAAPFRRGLPAGALEYLKSAGWWSDVLSYRYLADGADRPLIIAVRDGYLNVYAEGQSILEIRFLRTVDGEVRPRCRLHWKYVLPDVEGDVYLDFDGSEVSGRAHEMLPQTYEGRDTLHRWVTAGRDVTFSAYSVLAVFVALRLMSCGLPQGRAVFSLRKFREALEQEHRRMTEADIAALLEIDGTVIASANAVGREMLIAKGNVVESAENMIFFCVHADLDAAGEMTRTIADEDGPRADNICRGKEQLERRVALDAYVQSPTLIVELMNPFIQLNHLLSKTEPARRGRRRGG